MSPGLHKEWSGRKGPVYRCLFSGDLLSIYCVPVLGVERDWRWVCEAPGSAPLLLSAPGPSHSLSGPSLLTQGYGESHRKMTFGTKWLRAWESRMEVQPPPRPLGIM